MRLLKIFVVMIVLGLSHIIVGGTADAIKHIVPVEKQNCAKGTTPYLQEADIKADRGLLMTRFFTNS